MSVLSGESVLAADGADVPLSRYRGFVLLVVNVASECGYATQAVELDALHRRHRVERFTVLAFPSGDFGALEPLEGAALAAAWQARGVSFPVFAKARVAGPGACGFYRRLAEAAGEPAWNFHKYLVGKDGKVIRAFGPDVAPLDPELVDAVQLALAEERTLAGPVRRRT